MFLDGKRALVTGSTSGIGLAIAQALAREGAALMVNGFGSEKDIGYIVEELSDLSGKRAYHDGADLMDPDAIDRMVARCTDEIGSPHILVNNAGMQHVAPIAEFPPEKWDQIIALNLSAVFHATRLVIPAMRQKGFGRIINTASAHSLVASPNKSAYVAAKHGVAGLTKAVALEVAKDNITANCISPGYVWTPLVGAASLPRTTAPGSASGDRPSSRAFRKRGPRGSARRSRPRVRCCDPTPRFPHRRCPAATMPAASSSLAARVALVLAWWLTPRSDAGSSRKAGSRASPS